MAAHIWDRMDLVLLTIFPSSMSGVIIPFAIEILNWNAYSPETNQINHIFGYALLGICIYGICAAIWIGLRISKWIEIQNKKDKAQWDMDYETRNQ